MSRIVRARQDWNGDEYWIVAGEQGAVTYRVSPGEIIGLVVVHVPRQFPGRSPCSSPCTVLEMDAFHEAMSMSVSSIRAQCDLAGTDEPMWEQLEHMHRTWMERLRS